MHDKSRTSWNHVQRSKKESGQKKIQIACIPSLEGNSAWDKFRHDSCCLASLFSIVHIFLFFRYDLYSVRFNCKKVVRQRDLRGCCKSRFFCVFYPYNFLPPSLLFSYFVVNLRASLHQMHPIVRELECTIVLRWKICRSLLFCILFDRKVLKT